MRRFLLVVLGLLLLLAVTAFLAVQMLPEDALRGRFAAEAERALGRPVIVTGAAEFDLWPWPTLTVSSVGVDGEGPELAVSEVVAELAPVRWLTEGIPVRSLQVRRPRVNMTTDDLPALAALLDLGGNSPALSVVDGHLRLLGPDGEIGLLSDVVLSGSAAIDGGYELVGRGTAGTEPLSFTLVVNRSGRLVSGDGIPVALTITTDLLQGGFDGSVGPNVVVGAIDVATPSLQRLIEVSALSPLPERLAPGRMTAVGDIRLTTDNVDLALDRFEADAITGSADVGVALSGPRPRIEGQVALDALTADQIAALFQGTSPADPIEPRPFSGIDADLTILIDELSAGELSVVGIEADVLQTDSHVNLAIASFAVAGGEIALQAALDAGRAMPAIALDIRADAVSLEPLWQGLAPRMGIAGTLSGRLVLTARAASIAAALGRLSGGGEVMLVDGLIQGIDIATGASGRQSETTVDRLTAGIRAEDGVVDLEDIRLEAGPLSLDGLGQVDLRDMRVAAELFTVSGPDGLMFLRVEGPLGEPQLLWQSLGLGEGDD